MYGESLPDDDFGDACGDDAGSGFSTRMSFDDYRRMRNKERSRL